MRKHISLLIAVATMATAQGAAAGEAMEPTRCADLSSLALADATITLTESREAGPFEAGFGQTIDLSAHCYVEGIREEREAADGTRYGLRFALGLPVDWNGRLLFQGGGGLNGTLHPPLGGNAAGRTPALARGFAVISTDGGHQGKGGFDASFMADQQAALDFAGQSVRKVTEVGKEIVRRHYGDGAHPTYISGCSTGGREAMLAAQRYPLLFDGAVVGAPAMRTGNSNFSLRRAVVAFNKAAPRGPDGEPVLARAFDQEDRAIVMDGLLDQCDGLDGLEDGIIGNVMQCDFDPRTLACSGDGEEGCISPAQADALVEAFGPLTNSAGYQLYPRFPFDTAMVDGASPFIPTERFFSPGATATQTQIDIDAEDTRMREASDGARTESYSWTNFSTFIGQGGKIIFYHGVSDAWFSAFDTLGFYRRAHEANEEWDDASRFYFVPGMGHCAGGLDTHDSFDLLSAVVDWTENGQAPQAIPASRANASTPTGKLCPFPSYPHFDGGDEDDADSFTCR